MNDKIYLEDYEVGETLVSPGRTITETDIVNFAGLTGDWNSIHTDAEFASKTMFKERVAHGMLVLCVGSSLLFRLGTYVALPKTLIAFMGMDEMRIRSPCRIGDTIRCKCVITELVPNDHRRGVMVCDNFIINQRDENLITYKTRALVGRRPAQE